MGCRTSSKKERLLNILQTPELPDLTADEVQTIDEAGRTIHHRNYVCMAIPGLAGISLLLTISSTDATHGAVEEHFWNKVVASSWLYNRLTCNERYEYIAG